jgi:hypothetical protein
MNPEAITNIETTKELDIFAISSSATSIELCGKLQDIPFSLQEGRVTVVEEPQNHSDMDVSVHTAKEFYYKTVVNPCFKVLLNKEENSSSISETEELSPERIRAFVEEGRISEAKNILSAVLPGNSYRLDNWRKVLSKPKVKIEETATGGTLKDDCLWLQKHSIDYKGQWVALKQGGLLSSHVSRIELHRSLKKAGTLAGAMFFWIDSDE